MPASTKTSQQGDQIEILIGGSWEGADAIYLYPEPLVTEWRAQLTRARSLLDGSGVGVGFVGSPGWVFGMAAAAGAIEALVSSAKAADYRALIRQASATYEDLRRASVAVAVSEIEGLDIADPSAWRSTGGPEPMVAMGEDFLGFRIEGRRVLVRWAQVAGIRVSVAGGDPLPPARTATATADPDSQFFLG